MRMTMMTMPKTTAVTATTTPDLGLAHRVARNGRAPAGQRRRAYRAAHAGMRPTSVIAHVRVAPRARLELGRGYQRQQERDGQRKWASWKPSRLLKPRQQSASPIPVRPGSERCPRVARAAPRRHASCAPCLPCTKCPDPVLCLEGIVPFPWAPILPTLRGMPRPHGQTNPMGCNDARSPWNAPIQWAAPMPQDPSLAWTAPTLWCAAAP